MFLSFCHGAVGLASVRRSSLACEAEPHSPPAELLLVILNELNAKLGKLTLSLLICISLEYLQKLVSNE